MRKGETILLDETFICVFFFVVFSGFLFVFTENSIYLLSGVFFVSFYDDRSIFTYMVHLWIHVFPMISYMRSINNNGFPYHKQCFSTSLKCYLANS